MDKERGKNARWKGRRREQRTCVFEKGGKMNKKGRLIGEGRTLDGDKMKE